MKKLISLLLTLAVALSAGAALAQEQALSVDSLTVTYVSSPLNVPSIVEKEQGIFSEALGVPVEYAEITSGADQTQALATAAEYLDLDVEAVREMYAYYDFSLELTDADVAGFQETADFMFESGMIEEAYDVSKLFF